MAAKYKKAKFTAQLPAVPCDPQMCNDVLLIAKATQASIAELGREAWSLFLSRPDSKAILSKVDLQK